MADDQKKIDEAYTLRHDIKNQISNIILAVEELRFEITDQNDDIKFYLDAISKSCTNINGILKK